MEFPAEGAVIFYTESVAVDEALVDFIRLIDGISGEGILGGISSEGLGIGDMMNLKRTSLGGFRRFTFARLLVGLPVRFLTVSRAIVLGFALGTAFFGAWLFAVSTSSFGHDGRKNRDEGKLVE